MKLLREMKVRRWLKKYLFSFFKKFVTNEKIFLGLLKLSKVFTEQYIFFIYMFNHFNHKLQTVEKWLQIPSNYSNLHSEPP